MRSEGRELFLAPLSVAGVPSAIIESKTIMPTTVYAYPETFFPPKPTFKTDCIYYSTKRVNYSENFDYASYFNAGDRTTLIECAIPTNNSMFWRPVEFPCDGCPWYTTESEPVTPLPDNYFWLLYGKELQEVDNGTDVDPSGAPTLAPVTFGDEERGNWDGYRYRRMITVDATGVSATLTSPQISVSIDDSEFAWHSKIRSDMYDVIFRDSENSMTPFEFTTLDPSGTSEVWVVIPYIRPE